MIYSKIKKEAGILKYLLNKYENAEPEEKTCLSALASVFDSIKNSNFEGPYDENPCGYYFVEGSLRNYSDLEEAYSNLLFTASDSDEDEMNKFFSSLDE